MMKKFLEVLVDEDGKFHFSTEEEFFTEEAFVAMAEILGCARPYGFDDRTVTRPLVGGPLVGGSFGIMVN